MRRVVTARTPGPLIALLALQAGLVIVSSWGNSPCCDEVGHVAAGLHHWETGTFDLYRVNPPLPRLVATLPLKALGVANPLCELDVRPPERPEFALGRRLIAAQGTNSVGWF